MSENTSSLTQKITTLTHLRRKTVVGILRTWRDLKVTARQAIGSPEVNPSLPKEDIDTLKKQMQLCLDTPGGEINARAQTAELGSIYLELNEAGRLRFLKLLATDFDLDQSKLRKLTDQYSTSASPSESLKLEIELRQALVTPRSIILKQFTALPDGFKFLVNMRADLLPLIGKDAKLKGLEYDLKAILSAWFDIGLLDLQEITWSSPAALLEKLIEYEAVHRITSWGDLKNRLDADRRVFAFFHNKMPMEPLIFVHVALVEGLGDNIHHLLDEKSPTFNIEKADTALFYSISNAQKGLAGISFGNFLIKRVVSVLTQEMPQLKTYATLSPIPGLRTWLDPLLIKEEESVLKPDERSALQKLSPETSAARGLYNLLEGDWPKNKAVAEALKPIMLRLTARYLIEEKKNGKLLDPVAKFHLFNGARLERLNWMADLSAKGLKQSAGIMANYYYKLSDIDNNHEEFVAGKVVTGKQVKNLL